MIPKSAPLSIGIIGAGIVGVSCCLYLQRAGHRVDIIDPNSPGEGASSGNAGILAVSEIIPFSTPATLRKVPGMLWDPHGPLRIRREYLLQITPWLFRFTLACRPAEQRAIMSALFDMLSHSWDAWSDLAQLPAAAALISRAGWLAVFENAENIRKRAPTVKLQRERGIEVRELNPQEVRDIEPSLASIFAGGLYYPQNGLVADPRKMVRILAEASIARGASLRREAVLSLGKSASGTVEVRTSTRDRVYDRVIVAAGAFSRGLMRTMDVDLPLDTERGYHLMLPKPDRSLRRSVSFSEHGFSLGPIGDAIRLTSGVEFAGLDAPANFGPIHHMVTHAQRFLPGLASDVRSEWLGFRPSFPDSLPVIGALRSNPKIILAFGHGHLGLTTGPLTGQIVTAIVDGQPVPFDLEQVSPHRWGL